jgi:hypothetical protein
MALIEPVQFCRATSPLPGFDVKTPKQVTQILQHLEQNPMLLAETGQKSRLFAEHFSKWYGRGITEEGNWVICPTSSIVSGSIQRKKPP